MNLDLLLLFLLSISASFPLSTSKGSSSYVVKCRQSPTSNSSLETFNMSSPSTEHCGLPEYLLSCTGGELTIEFSGRRYRVNKIDCARQVATVVDMEFLSRDACSWKMGNVTLDPDLFDPTEDNKKLVLFNCNAPLYSSTLHSLDCSDYTNGKEEHWYYFVDGEGWPNMEDWLASCDLPVVIPLQSKAMEELRNRTTVEKIREELSKGFDVRWNVQFDWCTYCRPSDASCSEDLQSQLACCFSTNSTNLWLCSSKSEGSKQNWVRKVLIACGSLVGGFLLAIGVVYLWLGRKKGNTRSISRKSLVRRDTDPLRAERDLESLTGFYHTPIFSYEELQEATGGFDSSKVLGDGGFGVVYKGYLKDGRVVAVKRLHERNYGRVQQFRNEVEILNRIRHPNLVSLYGCTTRDSRELLLVYEYVANGTLADHLHGPLASLRLLTWPLRLSIAVETAAALAYLHATEPQIIHRDVKTSNILLDNAFHVKVADFGLSRLFPSAVATHVSTAPQGTPGYVDPEYHQCYQLTDKSDVYSFGVVLVELISSKPAVDIDRPRSEINLSNIAMAKIPRGLVHELADPTLGYETDPATRRTIEAVAELAFRCLQPEKDMRPSMDEVKETLVLTEGGDGRKPGEYQTTDDASLLKSSEDDASRSPVTVIGKWTSRSTSNSASS